MRKYIWILLVIIILAVQCTNVVANNLPEAEVAEKEIINDRLDSDDIEVLKEYLAAAQERMTAAHNIAESARILKYTDEDDIIILAQKEYQIALDDYLYYEVKIEAIKNTDEYIFSEKAKEYPVATEIWLYLKNLGYSDVVCAGLMGNFMSEVGGQTLDIQYWISSNGYYGICQWGKSYSDVWNKDLLGQLNYLRDTIQYEINTFGNKYKQGFNYTQFLQMTNEKDVALAFAECYERCGSASYLVRQNNATTALKYFTSAPTADNQE